MAWAGSTRSARLPRNWPQLRRAVKKRAGGLCEAHPHHPDCNGVGTECDHIHPGDDHRLANLQWLSPPCHRAKTLSEATEARATRSRKRTPAPHPGIVTD